MDWLEDHFLVKLKKMFTQEEVLQFIEDNRIDVTEGYVSRKGQDLLIKFNNKDKLN